MGGIKIFHFICLVMLFGLLSCAGGTNPGGGGGGGVGDVSAEKTTAGGAGVGEGNFASPEMPEIALGPGFDGETKTPPRPVEVRIPAEVTIQCQSSDPKKVTKRIQGHLECRWANTNDPFQICGRGLDLRIFDNVSHHYIDVSSDEGNASFTVDFAFHLPKQTAAYYNPSSEAASDASNQPPPNVSLGSQPFDYSGLVSDETDLQVLGAVMKPQEYGKQKYCQTEAFCKGVKFFRDLGPFSFPAGHQVEGPNSGTPICGN